MAAQCSHCTMLLVTSVYGLLSLFSLISLCLSFLCFRCLVSTFELWQYVHQTFSWTPSSTIDARNDHFYGTVLIQVVSF